MANDFFKRGIEGLISGQIDLDTDDMRFALVRGYTVNISTHTFLSDVVSGGGTIVATTPALTGVSVTNGIYDAADSLFTSVPAGAAVPVLILYKHTGSNATARILMIIDTATGLPVTPDGGNISLTFDNGTNRIANFDA